MSDKTTDARGNNLDGREVFLVDRSMIGFGWACAPKGMTPAEVEAGLDARGEFYLPAMGGEPPTPWTVARRKSEDKGRVSPGFCAECPDTREHWYLLGGLSAVFLIAMEHEDTESAGFDSDLAIRGADDIVKGTA